MVLGIEYGCHMTGSLTSKISPMQSVYGSHGGRDGGTLDIDVSLKITRSDISWTQRDRSADDFVHQSHQGSDTSAEFLST